MQAEHIQGVIDKKNKRIPIRILICASTIFSGLLIIPTPNIITGILNIIIIKLPTAKFLLFSKFIDPEIAVMHVRVGEPIKKLIKITIMLLNSTFNTKPAIGIIMKNGI